MPYDQPGQIRRHIRYSTVGSAGRVPEDSEAGRTIAEAKVDDSSAAAFAKPRMPESFLPPLMQALYRDGLDLVSHDD